MSYKLSSTWLERFLQDKLTQVRINPILREKETEFVEFIKQCSTQLKELIAIKMQKKVTHLLLSKSNTEFKEQQISAFFQQLLINNE